MITYFPSSIPQWRYIRELTNKIKSGSAIYDYMDVRIKEISLQIVILRIVK